MIRVDDYDIDFDNMKVHVVPGSSLYKDSLYKEFDLIWSDCSGKEYTPRGTEPELAFKSPFAVHFLDTNRNFGGKPRLLEKITKAYIDYQVEKELLS